MSELSSVFAQEAAKAPQKSEPGFSPMLGIILMIAVFFFLIVLPQSRKAKKQAAFISSLQKGDNVVTQSGIYGKIYGITDRVVTLEVAPNIRIRVDRNTILGRETITADTAPTNNNNNKDSSKVA